MEEENTEEEFEDQNNELEDFNDYSVTRSEYYVKILPENFKSLVGHPIDITNKKSDEIIEIIGKSLGVLDYETNKASFWILDIIALQVIKFASRHDNHYRSIFISWLAGEFQIIRKKNPCREKFFNEINDLFCSTFKNLNSFHPLLHWDEMFHETSNFPTSFSEKFSTSFLKKNSNGMDKIYSHTEESKVDVNDVFNTIVEATFYIFGSEFRYTLIEEAFALEIEH